MNTTHRSMASLLVAAAIVLPGCASTSLTWAPRIIPETPPPPAGQVFVTKASGPRRTEFIAGRWQTVVGVGGPGPVDRITDQVLTIVRERYPFAEVIDTPLDEPAAAMAIARGATHMIMTSVLEWR